MEDKEIIPPEERLLGHVSDPYEDPDDHDDLTHDDLNDLCDKEDK